MKKLIFSILLALATTLIGQHALACGAKGTGEMQFPGCMKEMDGLGLKATVENNTWTWTTTPKDPKDTVYSFYFNSKGQQCMKITKKGDKEKEACGDEALKKSPFDMDPKTKEISITQDDPHDPNKTITAIVKMTDAKGGINNGFFIGPPKKETGNNGAAANAQDDGKYDKKCHVSVYDHSDTQSFSDTWDAYGVDGSSEPFSIHMSRSVPKAQQQNQADFSGKCSDETSSTLNLAGNCQINTGDNSSSISHQQCTPKEKVAGGGDPTGQVGIAKDEGG